MSNPELTIVIPVYNNTGVYDLVSDFYRLHDPETFRIIVIDQTKEGLYFDKEKPVHLHIKTYRNLGFSKAQNLGLKLSETPYTLLANDDIRLLHRDWYAAARTCVQKDGVLAVNPFPALRTWDGGGSPQWYWDIHAENFAWTKDKPFDSYTDEEYAKLKELLPGGDSPGTAMFFTLIRTELRDIVGYLDEAYWNNGEDYDLNRRIFLTCKNCNKKKGEHLGEQFRCSYDGATAFEPWKILTCTHSLIHHQCGVTKEISAQNNEGTAYDLIIKAKNIFNTKWGSETEHNPDIYGKSGSIKPNSDWETTVPL